jgi:hypothetical protein
MEPIYVRNIGIISFEQHPQGWRPCFGSIAMGKPLTPTVFPDPQDARRVGIQFAKKLIQEGLDELNRLCEESPQTL